MKRNKIVFFLSFSPCRCCKRARFAKCRANRIRNFIWFISTLMMEVDGGSVTITAVRFHTAPVTACFNSLRSAAENWENTCRAKPFQLLPVNQYNEQNATQIDYDELCGSVVVYSWVIILHPFTSQRELLWPKSFIVIEIGSPGSF